MQKRYGHEPQGHGSNKRNVSGRKKLPPNPSVIFRKPYKPQENLPSDPFSATQSQVSQTLDRTDKHYLDVDFLDGQLEIPNNPRLKKGELSLIRSLLDDPSQFANGHHFEQEISGGNDSVPSIERFFEITKTPDKEGLCNLIGEDNFFDESTKAAIVSIYKRQGLNQSEINGKLNSISETFSKLIFECFELCKEFSDEQKRRGFSIQAYKERTEKLTGDLSALRRQYFSKIFLSKDIKHAIWDQLSTKISGLLQSTEWYPDEPGGTENFFNEWGFIFKDLFEEFLRKRKFITEDDEVVLFNSEDTPLDFLSQTDSFFAITSGENEGLIFGVDYTVNPNKPKQRVLGRRFFMDNEAFIPLVEELKSKLIRNGTFDFYERMDTSNEIAFNAWKNSNKVLFAKLKRSLLEFRVEVYKKVLKPAFDEYIKGIDEDIPVQVKNIDDRNLEPRYMPTVNGVLEDLEDIRDEELEKAA